MRTCFSCFCHSLVHNCLSLKFTVGLTSHRRVPHIHLQNQTRYRVDQNQQNNRHEISRSWLGALQPLSPNGCQLFVSGSGSPVHSSREVRLSPKTSKCKETLMMDSDLKAQSEAKHPLSNSTSILHSNDTSSRTQLTGSTRPSITISSPSSSFSSSSRTIDPLPPVVITVSTASASTSRSPGRDAPLISNIEDDVEDENGDLVSVTRPTSLLTATRAAQGPQTDVLVVPARRQLSRRAGKEVEGEPVNGTYGLSSIPTSSGGIMCVHRFYSIMSVFFVLGDG